MAEDLGPWGRAQAEARAAQADTPQQPATVAPTQGLARGLPVGLLVWLGLLALAGIGFWAMTRFAPASLGLGDTDEALADFGMLALVSAGLVRLRGIDAGQAARHATIWVALIGVTALACAYRVELRDFGRQLQAQVERPESATPRAVVVLADAKGQFAVEGRVNGHPVRFVIDTGASDVVLSPEDAQAAGVDLSTLTYRQMFTTANGGAAGADYVAPSLDIGAIHLTNVRTAVNKTSMGESLLGMSVLRRMDSVEIRGDRMTLRWRG